jgi:hypothetical protein
MLNTRIKVILIINILCIIISSPIIAQEKFRTVILTDMTHDDGNSLIRYLYYSHLFDTEAIIVTPQLPDYNYNHKEPWQKVQSILSAYKEEYAQISQHHEGYPTHEELGAIKQLNGYYLRSIYK